MLDADDSKNIQLKGDALYDQAMLNCYSGKSHQQCIALLQQAIDLQKAEEFEVRRAVCLVGLGNVYGNMHEFKEALVYYHKAADIFEKHSVLNSLGCAFSNIGMCHIMLGHLKQAEQWLNRAQSLLSKAGSPGEMAGLYFNYAQLSTEQKDYNATYQNLLSCREYASESGDKAMHRRAVRALHELATELNDTPSANMFLKELEEVA
jgi:tetratricopeptide (TPR) repeat protein